MSRAACDLAETIKANLQNSDRERYYLHKVDFEHQTIERLIHQIGLALTQAASDAFKHAKKHINNILNYFSLDEDEQHELKTVLEVFSFHFEEKFRARAFTILAPTVSMDTSLKDQLIHKDIIKLLCADESERIIQSALQASYDAALRNYTALLEESGMDLDPIFNSWGMGLFLQHINPVNVSLVIAEVLSTRQLTENAAWLLDRVVQLQMFYELSDLYREMNQSLFRRK